MNRLWLGTSVGERLQLITAQGSGWRETRGRNSTASIPAACVSPIIHPLTHILFFFFHGANQHTSWSWINCFMCVFMESRKTCCWFLLVKHLVICERCRWSVTSRPNDSMISNNETINRAACSDLTTSKSRSIYTALGWESFKWHPREFYDWIQRGIL